MEQNYKRVIIQIRNKDLRDFKSYADYYNLSFSSAIIQLAKKGLEQEQVIHNLPRLIEIYELNKDSFSSNTKKEVKKK